VGQGVRTVKENLKGEGGQRPWAFFPSGHSRDKRRASFFFIIFKREEGRKMGVLASHIHVLKKVSLFEESNPFCCLFLNLLKKEKLCESLKFSYKTNCRDYGESSNLQRRVMNSIKIKFVDVSI